MRYFSIYLKLLISEFIHPVNYIASFFIGATINLAQGKTIFFSLIPYLVPIMVQSFTKASIKFDNRKKEILLMLPNECKDPAFVMNTNGKILASSGNSYDFFYSRGIKNIRQMFDDCGTREAFLSVEKSINSNSSSKLELYSDTEKKWYQIQVKANIQNKYVLVWLEDISERKDTEQKLEERMRHFEFMSDIGFILTKGGIVNKIMKQCTESMVSHLDAAFARIWILNGQDNILELRASSGKYTHIDGKHSRIPLGEKKIGLIAKSREAHISNTVIGDPKISNQTWAQQEGMCAFAGHPLIFETKIIGVMAMFSTQVLSHATLKSLKAVADVIALGIVQKQVKDQLKNLSENIEHPNQ